MRILSTLTMVGMVFASIATIGACKRQDDTQQPAQAPTATATYATYPQYPPAQQQPAYGSYPAAPPPAPSYAPYPAAPPPAQPPPATPAPAPAPGPAASGQMAVPGPVAFQCHDDVPCGTHRCNVQYGKCAFPCQTNVDCISPNTCVMGLCVPAPPGR